MAFASTLKKEGFQPEKVDTNAICTLESQNGGFEITAMHLHTRALVPDIDEATFQKMAEKADEGCPVSNLLRSGLKITIDAELIRQ